MTRVLFTSPAAYGHVHPMIPLGRALIDQGHEVYWATGADMCERVEQVGIPAVAAGLSGPARIAEFRRRYPEQFAISPEQRRAFGFPRHFGAVATPPMLDDLLPVVDDWKPAILVHDAGELAAPIAAAAAGLPHLTHSFGELIPRDLVAAAGAEVAPLWREHGLEPPEFAGCYDYRYLDIYPPSLQSVEHDHVRSRQLLRPVPFDAVGDERSAAGISRDPERPLVYLTFGTVFNDNEVVRLAIEAIRALDVQLIVTVGPDGDAHAFGPQPENVRMERYIPQTLLFDHTDVVVSHAGSGTMLAALTRGIPQLGLPQGADQFVNAANCTRAGVGLALSPEQVDGDAIADAVERLLQEPTFRDHAADIAAEIKSMPPPEHVATVVVALAESSRRSGEAPADDGRAEEIRVREKSP